MFSMAVPAVISAPIYRRAAHAMTKLTISNLRPWNSGK